MHMKNMLSWTFGRMASKSRAPTTIIQVVAYGPQITYAWLQILFISKIAWMHPMYTRLKFSWVMRDSYLNLTVFFFLFLGKPALELLH